MGYFLGTAGVLPTSVPIGFVFLHVVKEMPQSIVGAPCGNPGCSQVHAATAGAAVTTAVPSS